MESKDYYLGLTFEPSAVGWAVTDKDYHILRKCGKDLWGVHEFDMAQTAEKRRNARTSRRLNAKARIRLGLLRSYFAPAIEAVDPDFFTRLDNSKYLLSDKAACVRYSQIYFNDKGYKDRDYLHDYPTIFHLRSALLDMKHTGQVYDVRLVYLALANMFKHRGNSYFSTSSNMDVLNSEQMELQWECLLTSLADTCDITLRVVPLSHVLDILADHTVGKRTKAASLQELFLVEKKDKGAAAFLKCLCGLSVDASLLFPVSSDEKVSINFSSVSYEESIPELEEQLGDACYAVVEQMKSIYDFSALKSILAGCQYYSLAQVACYEKHHSDLECLKALYRQYLPSTAYKKMFCTDIPGSYSAYVNYLQEGGKRYRRGVGGSGGNATSRRQAMYNTIKKDFADCPKDDAQLAYVFSEIENEQFLLKQRTDTNGVIPNQVYAAEMRRILNNAGNYLPFLNDRDASGYTVSERILDLFSFCLPYYVGPIGRNSKTGWAVRKDATDTDPIYPWNLEEKIDMEATSKAFIENLIRSCTYIAGEKVLPKSSLIYERFTVLNEINAICIDGERIPTALKQQIYADLFMTGKSVTKKKLCNYLISKNTITSASQVSGIADVIGAQLSSYKKLKSILGDWIDTPEGTETAEDIIYWGTIYGESKKMFRKHLLHYVDQGRLSENQLLKISSCKFKGWGRLSREFLNLNGLKRPSESSPYSQMLTIMSALWDYSLNLNELIYSDDFTFRHELEKKRIHSVKTLSDFQYDDLEEFHFSAPVKRMVWRSLLIVKEIIDTMGYAPKRLFMEMARVNEPDYNHKNSKLDQKKNFLMHAYDKIPDNEDHQWKAEIKEAAESGALNRKKVYLYYCQMGYDLYTGEKIHLEDVLNDTSEIYNIDHIYPQHYVMDNSTDNNLVLVNKKANSILKSDRYPVPLEIWDNSAVRHVWDLLHRNGLMNDEKYRRLTSRTPFSEQQMGNFIAAQMIEVSQGAKSIAALLKDLLPDGSTLVTVKSANVAAFRQKFEFPRLRILNELHYAQQAYLNIVVGNVYYTKFTNDPWHFIRTDYAADRKKFHYNLAKMFDRPVYRNEQIAWDIGTKKEEGTIQTVQDMIKKTSSLLTHMPLEVHGGLANATVYPAAKAKADCYYPLKSSDVHLSDVTKYGGVTAASITYYFLVKHVERNKTVISIEALPSFYKPGVEKRPDGLEWYCKEQLAYKNVTILIPKIRKQTVIEINGYRMYLSGKSNNSITLRNAEQMFLPDPLLPYVKKLEKYAPLLLAVKKKKPDNLAFVNLYDNDLSEENNLKLYDILTEKHTKSLFAKRPQPAGSKLSACRSRFLMLPVPAQCLVLYQILLLSRVGICVADMTLIGGAAHFGLLQINKKLDCENNRIYLISQSVTGLHEKRIRIHPDLQNQARKPTVLTVG